MSKSKETEKIKPLDQVDIKDVNPEKRRLTRLASIVDSILNRLIPKFAPKIIIEEKLIENESKKDYALIRYYSELQILVGFVLLLVGIFGATYSNGIYLMVSILGGVLILTGFEIEEIYVTNIRVLIRKIGLLERLIRIASDEEHLLKHVVSFKIGRAPTQKILMTFAAIGFFTGLTITLGTVPGIVLLITSFSLFILGLRLGKRTLTLNLAGGHFIILGKRKGVPTHLIQSIMKSSFRE